MKEVRAVIAGLNLEPTHEQEVVEELSQHLCDRYDEMLGSGVSEEQAVQTLLKELNDGSLSAGLKATVHSAHPPLPVGKDETHRWFAGIWSDLRYGARLLRLNPGFAIVAIVSLALGIGANTTIFQLLDAVRLRSLPVKAPEQLATIHIRPGSGDRSGDFTWAHSEE
jgi:putative ABC transport system permease protein